MSISERSRRRVAEQLETFREAYGEFEIVEKTWEHAPDRYEALVERFERESIGGAGIWATDEHGNVLLVRDEGDEGWSDPGGKIEAGETYEAAARREVREETGIDCRITGLCEAHVIEHRPAEGEDPSVFGAIAIFLGERIEGEARPREGEIAAVDWFSEPPERVAYEEVGTRPYPGQE